MPLTSPRRTAFRIAAAYCLAGALWIAASDTLIYRLSRRRPVLEGIEVFKGWLFILVTGLLLYQLLRRSLERLRREQEDLRTQTELSGSMRRAIEEMGEGVLFLKHGQPVYANPSFCRMLGWASEELKELPSPLTFASGESQALASAWAGRMESPAGFRMEGEATLLARDGRRLEAELSVKPLEPGGLADHLVVLRDVSEARQDKLALRRQEEQYRLLFRNNPNPMFVYELAGMRILEANQAALGQYGYSREEFLGMNLKDLRPPEEVEALLKDVAGLPDRIHRSGCWRHRRKDGSLLTAEIISGPAIFQGRNCRLVLAQDVTERITTQQALEAQTRLYGTVLKALSDAGEGFVLAEGRKAVFCNPAIERILGRDAREILAADDILDFVAPEARQESLRRRALRDEGLTVSDTNESLLVHRSGRRVEVELCVSVSREGGSVRRFIIIRDIRARKEAERALRSQTHLYETMLKAQSDMRVGMALLRQRRVDYANEAVARITGYSLAELEGLDSVFLLVPEPERQAVEQDLRRRLEAGKAVERFEATVLHKDGRRLELELSIQPLAPDPERRTLLLLRDVTEARQAQREMLKSNKLESLGLLAGGVAHDFNNTLATVMGCLAMAKAGLEDPERLETLAGAENALRTAREMTRRLLDFARGGRLRRQPIDLEALLRSSVDLVLRGGRARVEYSLPPDLPRALGEESQLGQVASNLALNAAEAMKGQGLLKVRAERAILGEDNEALLPPGEYLKVEMEDEGPGVPVEIQDRIFDPYFSTKPGGTGLGLAASYAILSNHGGWLGLLPAPGKGAIFRFYLPVA